MGKTEYKTNREEQGESKRVQAEEQETTQTKNRSNNKSKSTIRDIRGGETGKNKASENNRAEDVDKKDEIQNSSIHGEATCHAKERKQKTTGEKKGKGLISGATSVAQGKYGVCTNPKCVCGSLQVKFKILNKKTNQRQSLDC